MTQTDVYSVAGPATLSDSASAGRLAVKKGVFSASLWTVASSFGTQAATFVIFIVLARALTPQDFGLVALAASFIDLARGVMLGGIPEALIQQADWDERVADTAFWLNVLGGLVFTLLIGAVSLGSHLMGFASPIWFVLAALSATLLIDALRAVHEAKLRRNFDYKKLATRSVLAAVIGGAVGIGMALAGFGVWALVGNRVVTSLAQTGIIWFATTYRPRLAFARDKVRPLLSFSFGVLSGRLLGQLNHRLADIVLGSIAGPAVLGLYRVGSRSLNFIIQATVTPLQATTLSAFARLESPQAQARAYVRFTQFTAAITFPAFFGAMAIASDFVVLVFGEKWAQSAAVMMLLTLGAVPITLAHFFQPAMQARGRPKAAVGPELTRLGVGVVVLSISGLFGIIASAAGDVLRRYLMLPQIFMVLRRELGVSPLQLVRGVLPPLAGSLGMAAVIIGLRYTLWSHLDPMIRIGCSVALGAVLYGGGMRVFANGYLRDVFDSLKSGLPAPLRRIGERLVA